MSLYVLILYQVLWLDSDLWSWKPDLLVELLGTGKELVVPHCVCRDKVGVTYDRNSWQDTNESRAFLEGLSEGSFKLSLPLPVLFTLFTCPFRTSHILDYPVFEGYYELHRMHMDDLLKAGHKGLVHLDGIGGTCILIKVGMLF